MSHRGGVSWRYLSVATKKPHCAGLKIPRMSQGNVGIGTEIHSSHILDQDNRNG
ncbi:unnamed protein product [Callosobruchus maculatus]|uniref:Uncharacterized protein n=1 Tax=Callosobruchus maculatus TaxID=64391 RepID=A0A653D8V3_CALMS|nr:unnamed protein product [Callosobruchus maculatus]